MAEECVQLPSDNQNIEYHIVSLFEKLEAFRNEQPIQQINPIKVPVQVEIRSLEFWRSVICECLASFIYVFVVCGAAAGSGPGNNLPFVLLATALAAGFTMTTLTQCFGHISGKKSV